MVREFSGRARGGRKSRELPQINVERFARREGGTHPWWKNRRWLPRFSPPTLFDILAYQSSRYAMTLLGDAPGRT
jgi:hypothetical protein